MNQAIIFGVSLIILVVAFFVFKNNNRFFSRFIKTLAVIYFAWAFFRFMLADSFIWVINKGIYSGTYYESTDVLQSVLRWGQYISYVVLPMACFFNSRLFKNLAIYFCLPFTILNTIFFADFMQYFMGVGMEAGRGIQLSEALRATYFSVELILGIIIPLLFVVVEKYHFNVKSKTEWRNFFVALPFVILALIPVYIPQSFIGYTNITTTALTIGNLIWWAITITEIIVLYLVFRFRPYRERYMICMFLALALFMHYNSLYLMGFTVARLPIQLCNLGAYFFVVALILKNRGFFNFVFLANVVGTLIAMIMPDTEGGFAGFWNVHFLIEHMQVLVIPILCMLLRIFPRVDKSALKHLVIGFSCYFVFCWISGTILNAYALEGGYGKVNFFYIFDLEKAFDYFPFISFTQNIHWVLFGKFEIWPVFQLMVYGGFLLLCLLFYFLVLKIYDVLDDHFELRKARIDMIEKITGKKLNLKRDYDPDDIDPKQKQQIEKQKQQQKQQQIEKQQQIDGQKTKNKLKT